MVENVRFPLSLESDILENFDYVIREKKYESRSKAIRDLIREFLIEREWENLERSVMGDLALLYCYDAQGVTERLLDIQHKRCANVVSKMHIHLGEYNCMEVVAIKGLTQEVREVSDNLISCRGIKHGKLVEGDSRFVLSYS